MRSQGCTGCMCTPRVEKIYLGAKLTVESCKCTPRQGVCPQAEQESIFEAVGEILMVGVVTGIWVVLAKKSAPPEKNPGYVYG